MTPRKMTSLSREEFAKFFDSIDVVLSDCDGVLWRENEVIDGAPETVSKLKQLGKKFFFITNNNSKTRSEFVDKCKGLNYSATLDEIVCTSYLAAQYLKEHGFNKTAYVIGNPGMAKEMDEAGIKHIGIGPDPVEVDALHTIENFVPDSKVGAVVVGFDCCFSYAKLAKAATYLKNPNVHFLGTNPDTERPSPNNNSFPDAGCFVRIVELASFRTATILGKPEPYICEHVMKKFNLDPLRTLMIGDNPSTDVLLGKRCGFKTLLVLSGVTNQADVEAMGKSSKSSTVPDFYTDQLSDFLKMFKSSKK